MLLLLGLLHRYYSWGQHADSVGRRDRGCGDGGWPTVGSHDGIDVQPLLYSSSELLIHVIPVRIDVQDEPGLVLVAPRQRPGLEFGKQSGGDPLNDSCWWQRESYL